MTDAVAPSPHTSPEIEQDHKDIRRGSTLSLMGFAARLCARVPFLLIAGRLYGTAAYGEYVLMTAVVETAALLSSFGLKRTLFRCMDLNPDQTIAVIRHAIMIALGVSLLLSATIQVFAEEILALFSMAGGADKLAVLACAIPLISLTDVFLTATLSRRVMRYEVAVRSFVEPITLTVMSLFFLLAGLQYLGLIYAFLCAFGLAACISALYCYRMFGGSVFIGTFRKRLFISVVQSSSYTYFHDIARAFVSRLDTFAVGYFFSTSAVGIYGMAQQFLTVVEKVALSFYPMLMPVVSSAVSTGDRVRLNSQLRSAGQRLVLLQLPVIIVFLLYGKGLLGLIGPEYVAGWPVLMILAIGCWVNAVMQLVEVPLTYLRPHVNLVGCFSAIGIYLVVISSMHSVWALEGIAMTSVFSAFLANVGLIVVFVRAPMGQS